MWCVKVMLYTSHAAEQLVMASAQLTELHVHTCMLLVSPIAKPALNVGLDKADQMHL